MKRIAKLRREINKLDKIRQGTTDFYTYDSCKHNIEKLLLQIEEIKLKEDLSVCICGSDTVVESCRIKALWSLHGNKYICDDYRADSSQHSYKCASCGRKITESIIDELHALTK